MQEESKTRRNNKISKRAARARLGKKIKKISGYFKIIGDVESLKGVCIQIAQRGYPSALEKCLPLLAEKEELRSLINIK